nr:clockwork orange [Gampsocleis gratiosa]
METPTYWEEASPAAQHVKFESGSSTEGSTLALKEERSVFHYCDGNLNFATVATSEDDDYSFHKKKVSRDPMSHRIIEKRRRDRMNNCLADLSRLIPADYLKKGRGRIEKTEIIEMAIKHMKHLQMHACRQLDTCELAQQQNREEIAEQHPPGGPIVVEHYRLGYQECLSEAMHFMVEVEGFFAGDPLCVQLINHLQKHCDRILKGDRLNFPRTHLGETTSTSSGSTGSGSYSHHGNTIPLGSSGLGSSSSPGSGSGSCSDSGRTENKDSGINCRISPVTQSVPKMPPQALTSEDNSYEEGLTPLSVPSQLREMLTTTNLTSYSIANNPSITGSSQHSAHPDVHPAVSPGLQHMIGHSATGMSDHLPVNGSSAASLYKFKNNIKQRFTAEHHFEDRREHTASVNSQDMSDIHYVSTKRRRYTSETNEDVAAGNNLLTLSIQPPEMTRHRDSETCSVPSCPPSPVPKFPQARSPSPDTTALAPLSPHKPLSNPSFGVPIFALHSKGSFYIPLTLDSDMLGPYLADLGHDAENHNMSMALHPVTISVNFQYANHVKAQSRQPQINQCSSNIPWKSEPNGFYPIKWSVCASERN